MTSSDTGALALTPPLFSDTIPDKATALYRVAQRLLRRLEKGDALDTPALRTAMLHVFGATDAAGAWVWKEAYDAAEVAEVLFLQKYGATLLAQAGEPKAALAMLERLAALAPSETRRSETSQALQQFSTPLPLAFVAAHAAALTRADSVLEPSAGTGLLGVFATCVGAELRLNEIADVRAGLLQRVFRGVPLTRRNAEQIDDYLGPEIRPTVVLMNPPFSASPNVQGRSALAVYRHLAAALRQLEPGGRLVAITGAGFSPHAPAWRDAFIRLQERGRLAFTAAIDGRVYARHGTTIDTRLTVIDRVPAKDSAVFPACCGPAASAAALLALVEAHVPPRPGLPERVATVEPRQRVQAPRTEPVARTTATPRVANTTGEAERHRTDADRAVELDYQTRDWKAPDERIADSLYEPYVVQSVVVPGSRPHPSPLVQSAAMAAVAPPKPAYRPHLYRDLVEQGVLSDAQLEQVVYAGEAHAGHLAGWYSVDDTWDGVAASREGEPGTVQFRRGYFIGDGTGAGKGREVAGILLDNWLKGRRRAVWISKSASLLEDAVRDWTAVGGYASQIVPQWKYQQGGAIALGDGVLFTTYATLRTQERGENVSRVEQIVRWLGRDFDGLIVFDEAHAMANAGGETSERGDKKPSLQGQAGLRLQNALADARVLYVSATGATTVRNLAYAARLGLWGTGDFPFATRAAFVAEMEGGGVAAMEVLARDLKALGLYAARSLSFDGIEYELLEHRLTHVQRSVYDAYAAAFRVIHNNLSAALEAMNITQPGEGTLNRQAKAAALSAFESAKQRFFNYLLTAMKCPTLIRAIEADLAQGDAAVVQIVSTGEALLDRRLAEIPTGSWHDVDVDITPREYVLDYLANAFPTQLYEPYTDDEGHLHSRPVYDEDGNRVQSREAIEQRDAAMEHLAALPPVPAALDQLLHHFGTDAVAEVTGRSKRIVLARHAEGDRYAVQSRPASSNLGETQAFMDDRKQLLVFSDAGGTGRSYHADLAALNQRRRIHYLLEPGWKADAAIQGLGRTNRTNQRVEPLYRLVTTTVKGEKRFVSTIARRLDTLGAITRGQRQTGGQGLFRETDNLEGQYARIALRKFFRLVYEGKIDGCSLLAFIGHTGLKLTDGDGCLKAQLPPITQFLNRLLALPIALQNQLFGVFEERLTAEIEAAIAAGTYDVGVETLTAESLILRERRTVFTHASGAETRICHIEKKERNRPRLLDEVLAVDHGRRCVNAQSGRAALVVGTRAQVDDDGRVIERVRLVRPMAKEAMSVEEFEASHWEAADAAAFSAAWRTELVSIPEFTTKSLYLVSGLLLPIWDRLPDHNIRVYRLQTDDGRRLIGRVVAAEALKAVYANLGLAADAPTLSAAEAWESVMVRGVRLELAGGRTLRRTLAMGTYRCELCGFDPDELASLKARGLVSEIVSYRTRLFVPDTDAATGILASLIEERPVTRVVQATA